MNRYRLISVTVIKVKYKFGNTVKKLKFTGEKCTEVGFKSVNYFCS